MNHAALAVANDLYFDMAPAFDELFDNQSGIAERILCLAHRRVDLTGKAIEMRDGTHSSSTTSRRGLQHHRKPEFTHDSGDLAGIFAGLLAAGNSRYTRRFGLALGGTLVPEPFD